MQVGIAGCGTIGSEIAVAISNNTINGITLMGICDTDENRLESIVAGDGRFFIIFDSIHKRF